MARIFAKKRRFVAASLSQILVIISMIAAILYGVMDVPAPILIGSIPLDTAVKGCAVGFLALFALSRVGPLDVILLVPALTAHTLGDLFITGNIPGFLGDAGLVPAILAFAAGHILYSVIFVLNLTAFESLSFIRIQAAALLMGIAGFALYWFWPQIDLQPVLVQVYSGVLIVMALFALLSRYPIFMVGVGALLYVISDSLLGATLFMDMSHGLDIAVWPTYYVGQLLITLGIVLTPRSLGTTGKYRFV